MKLDQALDEFDLLQRRRHRGAEGRLEATALSALRQFLTDYSAYLDTTEIRPSDLFSFLLDYYPSEEEPDPEVGMALLETTSGFARWLIERDERGLAPFAAAEFGLREDMPRVMELFRILKDHAHREDPSGPGVVTDEEGNEELAHVETPYNRTHQLEQIDYASAEEEYYSVERNDDEGVFLTSTERQALESGPAGPLNVPAAAKERLRVGDIIHAEIAPGPRGWELLEVFGVRPGGYQ